MTLGILLATSAIAALGATTFFNHDEPVAGWTLLGLSLSYLPISGLFLVTADVHLTAAVALVIATINNITIHVVLGGLVQSGGIALWGISASVVAVIVLRWAWARAYVVAVSLGGIALLIAEPALRASRAAPHPDLAPQTLTFVLVGTLVTTIPLLRFLLHRVTFERARAESLLLNVLPHSIAAELKERGSVHARRHESISVLFADIVGFTPMSAELDPERMVDLLNGVFSHFDALTQEFGCEKIRTIGDNYMAAAGVPDERDDHAIVLTRMALRMQEYAEATPFRFRIGINSGPAVAGVIGTRKFQYDVWGDTVNTASRMESHGEPGRIQIGEETHQLIAGEFECIPRGELGVKGKGSMQTWWVVGLRPGV